MCVCMCVCVAGLRPEGIKGNIEFKDVHFAYAGRRDVPIFQGFNLTIKPVSERERGA